MASTIFFSWQIDRPNGGERHLIEQAIKDAIARIAADAMVEEAVREGLDVDRDTKGVGGTPPIIETIFSKIDRAAIFVPDLTFVCHRADGRLSPNPNVLIEYGWALKSRSHTRMMPVMNVFHGDPATESMPFDMAHLRHPIKFNLPESASKEVRRATRDTLSKELEAALRVMISNGVFGKPTETSPEFPAAMPTQRGSRFRHPGTPLGKTYASLLIEKPRNVFLADGPALWLRVMPVSKPNHEWSTSDLKNAVCSGDHLVPVSTTIGAMAYLHGDDGFGIYSAPLGDDGRTPIVLYIFHTGEVWSIDAGSITPHGGILIRSVEMNRELTLYTAFLKTKLGVKPPYRCIVGIEGVQDKPIWLPQKAGRAILQNPAGSCVSDIISVKDSLAAEDTDTRDIVRKFFRTVLEKCGIPNPASFDEV